MTAKVTKQNIIEVSEEILEKIKSISESHTYTADSDLYYEGQIPVVAYLLLKGEVTLIKKRRKSIPIRHGSLFGLKELMRLEKSVYGAQIKAGSEVCFLNRSSINEIINLEIDEDLKAIFEDLLLKIAS